MLLFIRGCYEKIGRMLKPLVPKFRPDLAARIKDNADIQENILLMSMSEY